MTYKEILDKLIKDLESDINSASSCEEILKSITTTTRSYKEEKEAEDAMGSRQEDSLKLELTVSKVKQLIKKEEEDKENVLKYYRKTRLGGGLTVEGLRIASHRNHTISKMKELLAIFEGK